jgi:Glyoxalase/Bleomycin resistance protein/Dioxygenase superfamily
MFWRPEILTIPLANSKFNYFISTWPVNMLSPGMSCSYCVGSRTGVAISRADPQYHDDHFHQRRIGLHHFCFRARTRADVDEIFQFVEGLGARVVHGPQEDHFAPGYYSILFEDPDGIRIEVNHVPGKGLLDPQAQLPLGDTLSAKP